MYGAPKKKKKGFFAGGGKGKRGYQKRKQKLLRKKTTPGEESLKKKPFSEVGEYVGKKSNQKKRCCHTFQRGTKNEKGRGKGRIPAKRNSGGGEEKGPQLN